MITTQLRPRTRKRPRIALVHDQLYTFGGAEQVLQNILACFPEADVFALFDLLGDEERRFLGDREVTTTLLQRMPGLRRFHRLYFPLMPIAIEQLDLSSYDIVISSSYLVAKGVVLGPDQLHICYLHSPMRYAWDLQHRYLHDMRLATGVRSVFTRLALHYLRIWDARTADGVDLFVANSRFIARRARRTYRRDSVVVYPPVEIARFHCGPPLDEREPYYLTLGRLVPYKSYDLLVRAFNAMPGRQLKVVGDGPELRRLKEMAGPNVSILGRRSNDEVERLLANARAFVYAAEEDFGIVAVEAMASGTPVIALRRGGLVETVTALGESRQTATGLFFDEPRPEHVIEAVERYERNLAGFDAASCRRHAATFGAERFQAEFTQLVRESHQRLDEEIRPLEENSAPNPVVSLHG